MKQNNLFYLCGPMGAGKTTLAEELARLNPMIFIPELYSRNIKFHTAPELRRALKISGRAIENFEYLKLAKENPDRIILGNRCIYDCIAYNNIYFERGWITKDTYNFATNLCQHIFEVENSEPYAIILNPGFDMVTKHLSQRQRSGTKKWGESDVKFVWLACKQFEEFKEKNDILYIDREINTEDPKNSLDLFEINKWIVNKYLKQRSPILEKSQQTLTPSQHCSQL